MLLQGRTSCKSSLRAGPKRWVSLVSPPQLATRSWPHLLAVSWLLQTGSHWEFRLLSEDRSCRPTTTRRLKASQYLKTRPAAVSESLDTFPSFCFRGKVNSPCRRSCLLSLILHHTLEYPHHIGILPIRTILGRARFFTTSPSFHDLSWSKRGREGAGK